VSGSETTASHRSRGPGKARLAFEEDLDFLLRCGTPYAEVLSRLEIDSFPNLEKRLERYGRPDLLRQLRDIPPSSRQVPELPANERKQRANDRVFAALMTKARFEAGRASRGIPANSERSIRIVLTHRSIPVLQEV